MRLAVRARARIGSTMSCSPPNQAASKVISTADTMFQSILTVISAQ